MSALITIPQERRFVAQFNGRKSGLKWATEKRHLESHFQRNRELAECDPESLADVLLQAAGVGLSLNPALGHLYPIPYREDGVKRAQVTIGYRGLIAMAAAADTIKFIQGNLVREKDPVFRVFTTTGGRQIEHEEARGPRGDVTHAYCLAHFTNGGHHVEVMTAAELEACERAATARNAKGGAVWRGPFRSQMEIKSVIRRAWKFWPKDSAGRLERAMSVMDELEPFEPSSEPEVCIDQDQALRLHAVCTDAGMSGPEADAWLRRLAQRYGLAEIGNLPAGRFERTLGELRAYVAQWKGSR